MRNLSLERLNDLWKVTRLEWEHKLRCSVSKTFLCLQEHKGAMVQRAGDFGFCWKKSLDASLERYSNQREEPVTGNSLLRSGDHHTHSPRQPQTHHPLTWVRRQRQHHPWNISVFLHSQSSQERTLTRGQRDQKGLHRPEVRVWQEAGGLLCSELRGLSGKSICLCSFLLEL